MIGQGISRSAVKGYLKLARTPLDAAVGLLPGDREARQLALDRADATARALAGAVLRDQSLREDARRRRAAASARERAIKPQSEAEHKSVEADQPLDQRHEQAQQRRRRSAERSDEPRES